MNTSPHLSLVRAIARALKAVGYYEPGHPILRQMQREVLTALKAVGDPSKHVTLACAGSKLLVHEGQEALTDASSKTLAEHLFRRQIVCLRISQTATPAQMTNLIDSLSEPPEKLKALGGFAAKLGHDCGVQATEINFEALFAGTLGEINTDEPLVQLAVNELLRFHQEKDKAGLALNVSLSRVDSPESLGSLLDELLDSAAPGVVLNGTASGGAPAAKGSSAKDVRGSRGSGSSQLGDLGELSAEQLAELVAQSYQSTFEKQTSGGANEAALAETAKVLSSAMARLSPDARFTLLKSLSSNPGGGGGGAAGASAASMKSLAGQLDNSLVLQTLAAAMSKQGADGETVSSVCTLIRSLRPLESSRKKLLEDLDEHLKQEGTPLEGALWQELQAGAMNQNGLGLLEFAVRDNTESLAKAFQARVTAPTNPPAIAAVLETFKPAQKTARVAALLLELSPAGAELSGPFAQVARDAVESADPELPLSPPLMDLLLRLVANADKYGPKAPQGQFGRGLLAGPKGALRAMAVAKSGLMKASPVLSESLFAAFEVPLRTDQRKELAQVFSNLPSEGLQQLKLRASESTGAALPHLISAIVKAHPKAATEFVRSALRNKDHRSKGHILRSYSDAGMGAVALLAAAAGVESDEASKKAMLLEENTSEDALRALQRVAVEALGLTRHESAVAHLELLLNRKKVFGGAAFDALRADAAKALALNGTGAAAKVLATGRMSGHKAVREACERVQNLERKA